MWGCCAPHFRSTWPHQSRCQLHKFAASLLWLAADFVPLWRCSASCLSASRLSKFARVLAPASYPLTPLAAPLGLPAVSRRAR